MLSASLRPSSYTFAHTLKLQTWMRGRLYSSTSTMRFRAGSLTWPAAVPLLSAPAAPWAPAEAAAAADMKAPPCACAAARARLETWDKADIREACRQHTQVDNAREEDATTMYEGRKQATGRAWGQAHMQLQHFRYETHAGRRQHAAPQLGPNTLLKAAPQHMCRHTCASGDM